MKNILPILLLILIGFDLKERSKAFKCMYGITLIVGVINFILGVF